MTPAVLSDMEAIERACRSIFHESQNSIARLVAESPPGSDEATQQAAARRLVSVVEQIEAKIQDMGQRVERLTQDGSLGDVIEYVTVMYQGTCDACAEARRRVQQFLGRN